MRRGWPIIGAATATAVLLMAGPALACGGLLAPNGTINLLRTSTLAAYHDGVEHYVTGFEFAGAGGKFGSIIPLPDVPTKVIKGGRWTLQRLQIETQPPTFERLALDTLTAQAASAPKAEVILEAEIDALDVTVLKGGGDEVGLWAKENGFNLPPDAPEVLDFYAQRSPIFMAAKFNAERAAARGQQKGDSTPVHAVIPTDDPWVPLRILGLGKADAEIVDADVYLLTDNIPAMLPRPELDSDTMNIKYNDAASPLLLRELRSDRGMSWLPKKGMWLTYIRVKGEAEDIRHDLALNVDGGTPSAADAGLGGTPLSNLVPDEETSRMWAWAIAVGLTAAAFVFADRFVASRR
jgi:Uncharacterized protein conserved in bacteria (DUF2330)